MGGHVHGGEPYAVPHPSVYKVDNIPQLKEVQDALHRQGLKDPWLRNEAWRYEVSKFGSHASRSRMFFLRGLLWGTALTVATVAIEYAMSGDDDHGHGHEHGNHNTGVD